MNRFLSFCLHIAAAVLPAVADGTDYSDGILWVNEDWYGHQNSTVNFLMPDNPEGECWKYRIIQTENPGMELGCTNQYGALWNGRLYLIAKQEKDPGASVTGGRVTVADAETMKILHQQELIDPSGKQCDGRGFLGINEHKGYISTSNGVWIYDLDNFAVTGQVAGTSNPSAGGDQDKPNTDPTGALYRGQSGSMVMAEGRVFIAHQQYGLLVVDPEKDAVVSTLSMDIVSEGAGIGSVVKSKDGSLWLSVAKNCQGTGATLGFIVKVDPVTLACEVIPVPAGMYPPANSWYAWTPDAFVASSVQNCLYWKGGPSRWFSGDFIYKFDCDTRTQSLFVNLQEEEGDWKIYGCALGVDPVSDDVYMAMYHEFSIPEYLVRRYSPAGEKLRDYQMISNYWFPSLPIFVHSGALPEDPDSGVRKEMNEAETTGDLYSLDGRRVRSGIGFGEWSGLPQGVYVWASGHSSKKIVLR